MASSRVTVRYFLVPPFQEGQPSFEAALKKVMSAGMGTSPAREVVGLIIQAGDFAEKAGRISGDMIRLQDDNFPSVVEGKGIKPKELVIAGNEPNFGHHAAFIYDPTIHVLAYQIAPEAPSLGQFNAFLGAVNECGLFSFFPVIKASDLKQLNKMNPKTLLIKVGDPENLDATETDERKLKGAIKNLRELAGGMYVKVQVGLGGYDGELSKTNLPKIITFLLGQRDKKRGKVQTIQVMGKDIDQQDVPLDFIKAQIGDLKNMSLGKAGSDENYKKRNEFLESCLEKRHAELKAFKVKK